MKTLLGPLFLACTLSAVFSARILKPEKQENDRTIVSSLDMLLKDVIKANTANDGNGNFLRRLKTEKRSHGSVIRVVQEYLGLRVYGFQINIYQVEAQQVKEIDRKTNKPTGKTVIISARTITTGKFADKLEDDLGKVDAKILDPSFGLMVLKGRNNPKETANATAEAVIFVDPKTEKAQVAYLVSYLTEKVKKGEKQSTLSWPTALVSLKGEIITEYDRVQHQFIQANIGTGPGGNDKIGCYEYGNDRHIGFLRLTDFRSGTCRFATEVVEMYDMNECFPPGGGGFIAFLCAVLYPGTIWEFQCYKQDMDAVNGGCSPTNDVNYFAHKVYDMLESWYGPNPLTPALPLVMKTKFGPLDDAFYVPPPADFFIFGDGMSNFHPLTSLDVVGHEIAHKITQESSGPMYNEDQSGGLNEAFCDMTGKAAERFVRGYDSSSFIWGIANDVLKSTSSDYPQGSLRCMCDPTCDGNSIDHVANFVAPMNPHYSSGIYNKVFCILSQQWPHDLWDAYDLFYFAYTTKFGPTTNFFEGAEYTLHTFEEMQLSLHSSANGPWSYGWLDIQDVVDAFAEVGICCTKPDDLWICTAAASTSAQCFATDGRCLIKLDGEVGIQMALGTCPAGTVSDGCFFPVTPLFIALDGSSTAAYVCPAGSTYRIIYQTTPGSTATYIDGYAPIEVEDLLLIKCYQDITVGLTWVDASGGPGMTLTNVLGIKCV